MIVIITLDTSKKFQWYFQCTLTVFWLSLWQWFLQHLSQLTQWRKLCKIVNHQHSCIYHPSNTSFMCRRFMLFPFVKLLLLLFRLQNLCFILLRTKNKPFILLKSKSVNGLQRIIRKGISLYFSWTSQSQNKYFQ